MLKEIVELKKLNGNLAKVPKMDDLIADLYAEIWTYASPSSKAIRPRRLLTPTVESSVPPTDSNAGPIPSTTTATMEEGQIRPTDAQIGPGVDGTFEQHAQIQRPSTPLSAPLMSNEPAPAPEQSSTPARVRAQPIRKSQILKRATESVLVKSAIRAASPARRGSTILDSSHIKVVINTPGRGLSTNDTEIDGTAPDSAPGSVHDSADDESELSSAGDDDEDEGPLVPPPMDKPKFPNLSRLSSNSFTPGRSGDAEDVRDGGDMANRTELGVQDKPGSEERIDAT